MRRGATLLVTGIVAVGGGAGLGDLIGKANAEAHSQTAQLDENCLQNLGRQARQCRGVDSYIAHASSKQAGVEEVQEFIKRQKDEAKKGPEEDAKKGLFMGMLAWAVGIVLAKEIKKDR